MAYDIANALEPSTFNPAAMLQAKEENALAQQQNTRANEDQAMQRQIYTNQLDQQKQQKEAINTKAIYDTIDRVANAPPGQAAEALNFLASTRPEVAQFAEELAKQHGIDIKTLDDASARELAVETANHFGIAHQIARPGMAPHNVNPGDTVLDMNAQGGPKPIFSAPAKPEATGPMYQYIGPDGKPTYGSAKDVQGKAPYERPRSGINVTSPDGTSIQIGDNPGGPVKLTNTSRANLEKAFTDSQGNALMLQQQMRKWSPDFSTYGGQAGAWWNNVKDKAGVALPPQDQKALADFTSWKSDTNSLLSQYLNQLSGAAISPAEEVRLKGGFPNAEDGPTQYQNKANATLKRFALVQARSAYLLSHPELRLDAISIDGMQNQILTEANTLAKSLQAGGLPPDQAKAEAVKRTQARYGIGQ